VANELGMVDVNGGRVGRSVLLVVVVAAGEAAADETGVGVDVGRDKVGVGLTLKGKGVTCSPSIDPGFDGEKRPLPIHPRTINSASEQNAKSIKPTKKTTPPTSCLRRFLRLRRLPSAEDGRRAALVSEEGDFSEGGGVATTGSSSSSISTSMALKFSVRTKRVMNKLYL